MRAATATLLVSLLAAAPAPAATNIGLDHVVVAVNDLERAARDWEALGFVLKPGRPHANGIRNLHAKFPDGTEIELLATPAARDPLTARYRELLRAGEGPAFLALFAPGAAPAETLDDVFFGGRNASPTDRPEHFAHPNGASTLLAVWLAGSEPAAERRLFERIGAERHAAVRPLPDAYSVDVVTLAAGEIVVAERRPLSATGRRIVGATVAVRSLAGARAILARAKRRGVRETDHSLFVPPAATHGLWLELREVR